MGGRRRDEITGALWLLLTAAVGCGGLDPSQSAVVFVDADSKRQNLTVSVDGHVIDPALPWTTDAPAEVTVDDRTVLLDAATIAHVTRSGIEILDIGGDVDPNMVILIGQKRAIDEVAAQTDATVSEVDGRWHLSADGLLRTIGYVEPPRGLTGARPVFVSESWVDSPFIASGTADFEIVERSHDDVRLSVVGFYSSTRGALMLDARGRFDAPCTLGSGRYDVDGARVKLIPDHSNVVELELDGDGHLLGTASKLAFQFVDGGK